MNKLRSMIIGVLSLAVLAGACGNDETAATEASSPLAEFLGEDLFGGGEFDEVEYAAQEREREERVAACMAEQGFDYIPVDTSQFTFFEGEGDIDYDSREYAEKWGFGTTTQWFSQDEVGPDLVGYDDSAFDGEGEDFIDPNEAIVEQMDDGTREAYYTALYGDEDSFAVFEDDTLSDEELAEAEENFVWEPQGCQGEAWAEDANNAFYQEFDTELGEMYEAVQDDPRIVEAEQKVQDCVAEQGLEFSGFDEDLFLRWEDELFAIEELIGGFPGEDLSDEDFAAMSDEELDALFNQPRLFTPEARDRLAVIQAEEIELAVVVWDCDGGWNQQEELFREVSNEYEQRFIDENEDRLAEYKADGDS